MKDEQKFKGILALTIMLVGIVAILPWFRRREPASEAPLPRTRPAAVDRSAKPVNSVSGPAITPQEFLHAALADFNSEGDAMRRDEKLEAWVASVDFGEIPELIALLGKEETSKLNSEIKLRLFRKLAGNDPAAASQLALEQPEGKGRQEALTAVATVWATLNVSDAITWARQLPDDERAGPLLRIANEATATDPRQALELARELPASDARNELVTRVAGEWALRNPQEIANWAENINDNALRDQVLSRVAITWGDTDPGKAAELAIAQVSPGKPQSDAVIGIVQRWVQTQPGQAAAWVGAFPESELREIAARELVNLWTDKNASDAGKWVSELPPARSKDLVVEAYVNKIAVTLPEAAAQWASSIPEPDLRNRQLAAVAEKWLAKDPDSARPWIKASPLPDEVKQKLLGSGAN